jgi:hypothetical protein
MKLKPRQIIGLVAIVVFGGGLIWRLTQPSESEIIAQRMASVPRLNDTIQIPDLPPVDLPSFTVTAPASELGTAGGDTSGKAVWELSGIDYYSIGSQAAKDDLYCAGVLSAEFSARISEGDPDKMSILLRDSEALKHSGIGKLKTEGKADDDNWAGFTLAWSDKAEKDYAGTALRIPVADCTRRAAALAGVEEAGK